jgi:DnaK suppressor protein
MAHQRSQKSLLEGLKKQPKRINHFLNDLGVMPYEIKKNEAYMNANQRHHFEMILTLWQEKLWRDARQTLDELKKDSAIESDLADGASQEADFDIQFTNRAREKKLLLKINQALQRIKEGGYGYCLETGEPLGIERLEVRPIAEYSVESQEKQEKNKKMMSDDAWQDRYREEDED